MKNILARLWGEEDGQDLVEYALLVALLALGATGAMTTLAGSITTAFTNAGNSLTTTS
jgi:pilus assembly protein Flp/PilA